MADPVSIPTVQALLRATVANRIGPDESETHRTFTLLLGNAMEDDEEKWTKIPREHVNRFAIRLWLETPGTFYSEAIKSLLLGSIDSPGTTERSETTQHSETTEHSETTRHSERKTEEECSLTKEWLMVFFQRKLLKLNGEELKSTSVQQYKFRVADFLNLIKPLKDLTDMEAILDRLIAREDGEFISKVDNRLNMLKMIIRNLTPLEARRLIGTPEVQEKAANLLRDFTQAIMAERALEAQTKDQRPSEDEISNHMPWSEIVRMVEEYRSKLILSGLQSVGLDELEAAVATSLYVLENEPRRNEYGSLRCEPHNKVVDNWMDNGTVVLNDYKCGQIYGQYTFELSPDGKRLMSELMRRKQISNINWVFGRRNEINPRDNWPNTLRKIFKTVVGKPLISRYLRKYRISDLQHNGKLTYMSDKLNLAKQMGHSISEQQSVYTLRIHEEPAKDSPADDVNTFAPTLPVEEAADDDGTDDEVSEDEGGTARKRKPKLLWTEQEVTELRQLIDEFGSDVHRISTKANERDLLLKRRNLRKIKQKIDGLERRKEKGGA